MAGKKRIAADWPITLNEEVTLTLLALATRQVRQFPSLTQENDMINDEPHTYGVSIQKPYIGKNGRIRSLYASS